MQNRCMLIERSKSCRKFITAAFVMSRTCSLNVALSATAATSAQTIQFASSCISLLSRCFFALRCLILLSLFVFVFIMETTAVRTLIIDQLRNECWGRLKHLVLAVLVWMCRTSADIAISKREILNGKISETGSTDINGAETRVFLRYIQCGGFHVRISGI
jgi:hypothetical protein